MDENTLPRDSSSPEDPSVQNDNNDNHSETQERTSEKRPRSPEPDSILSPPNEPITEQVQAPTEAQAGQSGEETQPQYTSSQGNGPTEAEPSSPANEADTHSQANEATAPAADSPSAKRRRISFPGKSILKSLSQDDDTGNFNHDPQDDTITGNNDNIPSGDVTETFSGTSEFQRRNRKSIGRRVSFAATARIRMFERDDKEDELPKTTSYLEGLNPRIALDTPFLFGAEASTSDNNENADTMDSNMSQDAEQNSLEQGDQAVSSESELEHERSFEVSVYPGHSDSTGSSGITTSLFVRDSSDDTGGKSPFDDDIDQGSSSEDDEGNFYPSANLMKRSSGVGIYQGNNDDILGPQLQLGTQSQSQTDYADLFGDRESMHDDTEDYSMSGNDFKDPGDSLILNFRKHRSSLPGRSTSMLNNDDTADYSSIGQRRSDGTKSTDGPMSEHSGLITDEDTDMDITSPIGAGIHALAQEQPPAAFAQDEDNTDMFSEGGTTMDMTMPIGSGIVEINKATTSDDVPSELRRNSGNPLTTNSQPIPTTSSNPEHPSNNTNNHPTSTTNDTHTGSATNSTEQQPPSTPPRRISILRGGSPTSTPRRGLGTPGKFTPRTHARYNIFPEVIENQLKNVEASSTAPIFRASHVSPETSNLAKRIARYSIGASFTAPDRFQDKITSTQDTNQDDDTMDLDQAFSGSQFPNEVESLFNESIALVGSQFSTQPTQPTQSTQPTQPLQLSQQARIPSTPAQSTDVVMEGDEVFQNDEESMNEESFAELPPITLNKFLSLIGISFFELSASTRRRTQPHRPKSDHATYNIADIVKQMTVSVAELESYKSGCGILMPYVDESRKTTLELETRINNENPDFIRDFREGDTDLKDFIKDRFKLLKSHCRLDAIDMFSVWRSDLYNFQQESLEHHIAKLEEDKAMIRKVEAGFAGVRERITGRHAELKRQLEQSRQRQSAFLQCDKDRLASLAEAIEEQGTQLDQFRTILAKKKKEQADIAAKAEQVELTEQGLQSKIASAEKTIQEHSCTRPEDLARVKNVLATLQATHRWEPLRSNGNLFSPSGALEFVHDRSLKATINVAKIGKDPNAVQLSLLEDEGVGFGLSLAERPKLSIRALAPKSATGMKEYATLLKDFVSMVASKYKAGTAVSKILFDINQFWTKVKLLCRDVELVRAHHAVDLVAGSAENLKELEADGAGNSKRTTTTSKTVSSTTTSSSPIVLLDIRVLFTRSASGVRRSTRRRGRNNDDDGHMDEDGPAEPVKFYVWFTFTLEDLLSFPAPNSFTWRLEVVYGDIRHVVIRDQIADVVTPCAKRGGYEVLRDACIKVNQLLKA
ncbi:hypothetical protein BGZ52_002153 [Haplosporangium bisporale]|nr:hypothetical protein BGZ52_002153 [Haplosporangium bisporale]KAF9209003.1 hypothetical protein BGZ59_010321 [Podila verticillata]KFH64249.1 hypothetical protein MVEG_10074 [Podila verticillata NRRL 6337]